MNTRSDEEKAKQPYHLHRNIRFQVIPVSPSETNTPLQIVCFFDQTKNQNYAGGTEAVDQHFNGEIKKLRAEDCFRGELFETLMLTPQKNQIPAQKLLLLGLGDPATLSTEILTSVGRIAVQEVLKIGVSSFAFAPSLKDAGLSNFEAGEVSVALATGMQKALTSMLKLAETKLIPKPELKEVVFLAGAAHLEHSRAGLLKVLASEIS